MKLLIGIASCHVQRHYADTQRETWVKEMPEGFDIKFFLGNPNTGDPRPDEVFLNVGDGYKDCTAKTIEQCKWALEHEYDFMLKADLDTLIRPKELLNSGFEQFEFSGNFHRDGTVSGGAGYWIGRRGMAEVAKQNWPIPSRLDEDRVVSWILQAAEIYPQYTTRHKYLPGDVGMGPDMLTMHLSTCFACNRAYEYFDNGRYTPDMMIRTYKEGTDWVPKFNPLVITLDHPINHPIILNTQTLEPTRAYGQPDSIFVKGNVRPLRRFTR